MAENRLKIFVEGITDKKFLSDYLEHLGIKERVETIQDCKGNGDFLKGKYNTFISNFYDQGFKNLVIFDADNDFETRKKEVEELKLKNNLHFELFLFPNNSEVGEIEDLFFRIINKDHSAIFDCFEKYKDCLDSRYDKPSKEAKIYAYLDAIIKNKETFKNLSTRDYRNKEFIDLENKHLVPLRDFILSNL